MFHYLDNSNKICYNKSKANDRRLPPFYPERFGERRLGYALSGLIFRKGGASMEIALIVIDVVAIVADLVTIFMFIESRREKHADRNEK